MIGANPVLAIVSLTDNSAQESADRAELLVRELTHRAKNMFAVISAMSHQIGAMSADVASFQADFDERLNSLSANFFRARIGKAYRLLISFAHSSHSRGDTMPHKSPSTDRPCGWQRTRRNIWASPFTNSPRTP